MKKIFRFCNVLAFHTNFLSIVNEIWSLNLNGNLQFKLWNNMKCLRNDLTSLYKKHFYSFSERILRLKVYIDELQSHIQHDPFDNFLLAKERVVCNEVKNLMISKESNLRKKK